MGISVVKCEARAVRPGLDVNFELFGYIIGKTTIVKEF
jgi:hypothetical protein